MRRYASKLTRGVPAATLLPLVLVVAFAAVVGTALSVLAGAVSLRSTVRIPPTSVAVPTVAVVALGLFALVLLVAVVVTLVDWAALLESWAALSLWVRAPVVGFGCALLAAPTLAVSFDANSFRTVVGFAATWPFCSAGFVLRARRTRERRGLVAALVGSGYAQLRGPNRRTLAAVAGGLLALLAGALTAAANAWLSGGVGVGLSVGVGAVVWPLAAVVVHARYATTADAGGLIVRDVESIDGRRELTLVNDSERVIDMAGAHLRDTHHRRYHVDVDRELGPGQRCVIAVPASFSLAPDETAVSLPFGYTLERGSVLPVLFCRRGQRHELQRAGPADSAGGPDAE